MKPKPMFSPESMMRAKTAASQLSIMQDWIRNWLHRSDDDSSKSGAMYWTNIFIYQWGGFVKQLHYRVNYGRWNKTMAHEAFGEALLTLMAVGEKAGIDIFKAVDMSMKKYNAQEWKNKK